MMQRLSLSIARQTCSSNPDRTYILGSSDKNAGGGAVEKDEVEELLERLRYEACMYSWLLLTGGFQYAHVSVH